MLYNTKGLEFRDLVIFFVTFILTQKQMRYKKICYLYPEY